MNYEMGENSDTPRPTSTIAIGNVVVRTPDGQEWVYQRNGWLNMSVMRNGDSVTTLERKAMNENGGDQKSFHT